MHWGQPGSTRLLRTHSYQIRRMAGTPTAWRLPSNHQQLNSTGVENKTRLKVYNSLTKSKVEFISKEPNKISWYNCGPTVYDASHMGHARNYVTQDILRRIARDYFNYNVKFVMNVTDIDDKIIQRARQQHLLEQLRSNLTQITPQLIEQVQESFDNYFKNSIGKLVENQDKLHSFEQIFQKSKDDPKWKSDMILKEEKFGMWLDSLGAAQVALNRASLILAQSTENSRREAESLVDGASEVLSKWLDQKYGSTITDHAIFKKLALYWEKSFFDDMATLGVEPPTVLTRVSDYVEEIVTYVKKIIDRGFAYVDDGSVYFDVNAFDGAEVKEHAHHPSFVHTYAKLQPSSKSNKKLTDEGEGALSLNSISGGGKRSPADFALWKKSKPGEPGWDSEWGSGRPGWHIECSVMASAVLGEGMDIHSGGVDLMFPHHDNELAQSEAYHNCPQWVNYFLHTGHLHIEGLKMSKSLKNFITISDALKQHSARQLRLSFLAQRWDLGMDFAESAMAEVKKQESTFNNFFAVVKALRYERLQGNDNRSIELDNLRLAGSSHPLVPIFQSSRSDFHSALCDSFNTPEAMKHLLSLVNETNKFLSSPQIPSIRDEVDGRTLTFVCAIADWITKMLKVFGLIEIDGKGNDAAVTGNQTASNNLSIGWNTSAPWEKTLMSYLIQWSSFRDNARKVARDLLGAHSKQKPTSSKALTEGLGLLCETQFSDHLHQIRVSNASHDARTHFKAKDFGLFLPEDEGMRAALSSHLSIWYEFWTELDRISQSSEAQPKDVLIACDQLRDEKLIEVGVVLDDQDDGKALVKLLPPSLLIQAREEKAKLAQEKEEKIRALAAENERKRMEKIVKGKLKPTEMFRHLAEFSQFDEQGIPTHSAADNLEISKSKRKKFQKDWDFQNKLHLDYLAWLDAQNSDPQSSSPK